MAPQVSPTPIDAPFAEPPRLGLLRSVTPADVPDQEVGFTFNPENCGVSGVGNPDVCLDEEDVDEKDIPENAPTVVVQPVYAWAGDKCSSFDFRVRDWQARARRQLAATISYQVAHELWTGAQADVQGDDDNPRLASVASDEVTDGPTSAVDALARLEQGIADCVKGQRGVVHATRSAATHWQDHGLLRREGNLLLTVLDTIVIVDAGYDGSGPDGSPAGEDSQWAYATGLPIVRLGPERTLPDSLEEALNRSTNLVEFRAERKFAVGWDGCCHLAAQIDVGWPLLGGGS